MIERKVCRETSDASPFQFAHVEEREAIRVILLNPCNPRPDLPRQAFKTQCLQEGSQGSMKSIAELLAEGFRVVFGGPRIARI